MQPETSVSVPEPKVTVLPPVDVPVSKESMGSRIKNAGWVVAGFAIVALLLLIPMLFLQGALWASETFLPFLLNLAGFIFLVDVALVLPLAIFRRLRPFAGVGLQWSSLVFGLTTWLFGLIVTHELWGWMAVVIGLLMFGVGVVAMGMLASVFSGEWSVLFTLAIMLAVTFGVRLAGLSLSASGTR